MFYYNIYIFVSLYTHLSIVHIVTRWHPPSSYCFGALFDGGSLVRPPRPTATHCFLVVARPSVFSFSFLEHCELQAPTSEPLSYFGELSGFPMFAKSLANTTVSQSSYNSSSNRVLCFSLSAKLAAALERPKITFESRLVSDFGCLRMWKDRETESRTSLLAI